jgi:chemotaxis family two-component system response regulator PixG
MLIPASLSSLKPLMTTSYEVNTIAKLSNQIQACRQERFTGWLDLTIDTTQSQQWNLYFSQGDLVWATSTLHPIRRWYRQLYRHCSQLFSEQELQLPHIPDYDSLRFLVAQGKIRPDQMESVIEGQMMEILFDIIQWIKIFCQQSQGQLTCRKITVDTIEPSLVKIPAISVWQNATKLWEAWQRAGLADCSPNLAPVILKAERLQELTSPMVYRNLTALADGSQTCRDLAVKMNQHLLLVTKPILSCVRQELIGLTRVEDLDCSIGTVMSMPSESATVANSAIPTQPVHSERQSSAPLVAYIDDSQLDSLMMGNIISQAGYRYLTIQNSLEALPLLLEHKPDLIFLDLVMPIANGYEICSQIRRVSAFKNKPVVILTSNDKIVDRLRAKIVGATSFLPKPITPEKVISLLKLHLHQVRAIPSEKLQLVRGLSLERQVYKPGLTVSSD